MADVQFNRENPFINSFARDQERQDIEATRGQERDARDQQMQAQAENQTELRRQRTQTVAADKAYGEAAVQQVAPITQVVARPQPGPVQPNPDATSIESMPTGLPDRQETVTVRPASRSSAAVTNLAKAGAGKAAYELATADRKRSDDLDDKFIARLGGAKNPGDIDIAVNWYRQNGGTIPDNLLENKHMWAEVGGVAQAAKAAGLKGAKMGPIIKSIFDKHGRQDLAEAVPEPNEEDFTPHGSPFIAGDGTYHIMDTNGNEHVLDSKAGARPGKDGAGGGDTASVRTMKYKEKVLIDAGVDPTIARQMSLGGNLSITPAMVMQQARAVVNASKDIMGKPTITMEAAQAQASKSLQDAQRTVQRTVTPPETPGAPAAPAGARPGQVRAGDRVRILQEELKAESARPVSTPEDVQRKQSNIDSLSRELAALNVPAAPVGPQAAPTAPAVPASPAPAAQATAPPQRALASLKPGVVTTFANGQKWTIKNGQPMQVQ